MTTARDLPTFTGPNLTGEKQANFLPHIVRRHVTVARIEEITPKYRRIVLAGDALEGFPFAHFACNDHVKANFPDPETGQIIGYHEVPGQEDWERDEGEGEMIFRDYTPRAYASDTNELTLDFVIHEHGVAGLWARDAKVGDPLAINGPRANQLLPENYGHYLAAGDATALPAISRLIEEAPAGSHVTAVIEIADAAEEQDLAPLAGATLDLRWVHRDTAPIADGHRSALETAVRAVTVPDDLGDLFAFAAGEAGDITPIRRWLRREVGLPKRQIAVDGYWKRGTADHDHHTNDFDDDED